MLLELAQWLAAERLAHRNDFEIRRHLPDGADPDLRAGAAGPNHRERSTLTAWRWGANPGWVTEIEQQSGPEVEVVFRNGTARIDLEAEFEDGACGCGCVSAPTWSMTTTTTRPRRRRHRRRPSTTPGPGSVNSGPGSVDEERRRRRRRRTRPRGRRRLRLPFRLGQLRFRQLGDSGGSGSGSSGSGGSGSGHSGPG